MASQICKENLTKCYQTFQFGVIFGSPHLVVISVYKCTTLKWLAPLLIWQIWNTISIPRWSVLTNNISKPDSRFANLKNYLNCQCSFLSTWHRENQVDLLLMAVSKLRPNDRRYIPWPSQAIPEPLAATGLGTENCNQHLISRGHITPCLHTSFIGDY